MKNKLTKWISGIGLALAISSQSQAGDLPTGKVEAFAGNKSATTDLKICGKLFDRAGYYVRNINTINYDDEKFSPFTFVDINYSLGKGFGAVYETQFIDLGSSTLIQPRFGVEYFKGMGDLEFYALNSFNVPKENDSKVNGELVATLRYTPSLDKDSKWIGVLQLETVTNYGKDGLNFASQNFRLGVGKKRWECGVGLNLKESSNSLEKVVGIFGAYKF